MEHPVESFRHINPEQGGGAAYVLRKMEADWVVRVSSWNVYYDCRVFSRVLPYVSHCCRSHRLRHCPIEEEVNR